MNASLQELQTAAVQYLDHNDLIQDIIEKCQFYSSVQNKAYEFTVSIDPGSVIELNARLGNLLLNQPVAAAKIFQEVIYMTIHTLNLLPKCKDPTQIIVAFKLKSLPAVKEYHLICAKDFVRCAQQSKFLQYEGIVCSMSTVHKYTKAARFVCPESDCPGAEGDKYIRLHIPGAKERQTIRNDFKCTVCNSPLKEDVSCRVLADKLIVEMLDERVFNNLRELSRRCQSLTVYLRDELVHGIDIGQKLCVIGQPFLDVHQRINALEANSIMDQVIKQNSPQKPLDDFSAIPFTIKKLLEDRHGSPWSFGLSLAYAFAGHIVPAGAYLHLKLGLLLSLVGSPNKDNGGLDLLAVGSDTLVLHRLLDYAATYSSRAIIHNVSSPLTAALYKDNQGSGACFIEGGSLMLARNGLCIIHNLESYKKPIKYSLLQALENNKVHVDIPQKLNNQGPQQLFLERNCHVWATIDPTSQHKHQQLEDVQVDLNGRDITQALADVFGMVYFADVTPDSHAEYMQIHQCMLQAMGTYPISLVPEEDFKQFIHSTRERKVKFTESSKQLIKGYYVASRRIRATGVHMWTLPITAIKAVTSLSEAHAKLCLRSEVTDHDAVMAILLYEECVTTRSGQSVLGVKPLPHVKDNDLHIYIGQERDNQMYQFHEHVKRFINTHAIDLNTDNIPEE